MKKLVFWVNLIILANTLFAQANTEILSQIKNFIENPPQNNRLQNSLWKQATNQEIWEGYTITQIFNITRDNLIINGYNRNNLDGTWESIIINFQPVAIENNLINHISDSNAINIYNEITNIFGNPNRIIDYGFLQNIRVRRDLKAQWDKGQYQIYLNINDTFNIANNSGVDYIHLKIMRMGSFINLIPLSGFNINISSGYLLDSRGSQNNITSKDNFIFPIILDYNENEVLNHRFIYSGKISQVSNSEVVFTRSHSIAGSKNGESIYTLDRYTGNIEIIFYDNNAIVGRLRGKVEKLNIYEPLF